MTSKEYVIWLKGFVEACHEYAPTPKQWDALKDKLAEVTDEEINGTPIGEGGWGTPNTTPMWQQPHYPNPFTKPYVDPYNPYKVTCGSGSFGTTSTPGFAITTTPGQSSITIANPPFGFGTTSTTYGYPSGSAWYYTNNKPHNED
jgi:hypothetical protein